MGLGLPHPRPMPCSHVGSSLSLKHTRPDPAQALCTGCSFSRSTVPDTCVATPTSSHLPEGKLSPSQ